MKNFIAISETQHKKWEKELTENTILYIYAMTGYGKTVQAIAFAEAFYKKHVIYSASDDNFLSKVEQFIEENQKSKMKTLLILDDLQWLQIAAEQKKLFELLISQINQKQRIRILLLSRACLPDYLIPLQVTRQLTVENQDSLLLDKNQIKDLILKEQTLSVIGEDQLYSLIQNTESATKGYGLAVHAYLNRIMQYPKDEQTAIMLAKKDIGSFLDSHLLSEWTQSRRETAISLSVFPKFTLQMATELLGENAENAIKDFMAVGSFLLLTAQDTYQFVSFFQQFLITKLKERTKSSRNQLYERAAMCYEKKRDFEEALRCYREAERTDKVVELIIYLSENADGCSFARISEEYLDNLSPDWEVREPRILSAKVMIAAYHMKAEESKKYLQQLKVLVEQEKKSVMKSDALATYVRTVIANPCASADEFKENLLIFADYIKKYGLKIKNIMPTGNMPSLINGGLDLLPWEKNKVLLYPIIKATSELVMGSEATGIADASMGEILYEQNKKTAAVASLTKALSDANLHENIRVQFSVTGVMARVFLSEKQAKTAVDILENIKKNATQHYFFELLPNIDASLVLCALMMNDSQKYTDWLDTAVNEHDTFYITSRYQLLVKARVYTTLGRHMEALYIIGLLWEYADSYHRTYLCIELQILKAIILYRREEDWQELLIEAVKTASQYGLIRIFADQGIALLPLWNALSQESTELEKINDKYKKTISKELKLMADAYPNYLKAPKRFAALSEKEMVVLRLMAQGYNNTEIAKTLNLNVGTVKFHTSNIMKKLEAENRTVAVKIAQEKNIL